MSIHRTNQRIFVMRRVYIYVLGIQFSRTSQKHVLKSIFLTKKQKNDFLNKIHKKSHVIFGRKQKLRKKKKQRRKSMKNVKEKISIILRKRSDYYFVISINRLR